MSRRCELTGKGVLVGNNVSHANNKSKRRFLPNLQEASILSDALGREVRLRISRQAQRSIDHSGGFDSYIVRLEDESLSVRARRLKRDISAAMAARAS